MLFRSEVAEVVDQPMEEGEPEPPPVTCSDDVYALSDQEALAELVFNHDDPAVRNTATGLIDNVTLLTDIVDKTNDEKIRETAEKKLETLEIISALEKYDDKDEAKSMVEKQKDDLILAGIAMSHLPTDIRELAIRKIDEYKVLADVAKYEKTRQISSNYDAVFRLNEALACRANSGTVAAVEELVRLGADVNNTARPFKCTPLHEAATGGNVEVAEFLIKQGANVNAKNTEGTTPLNNKVGSGGDRMVEMVELLVKHGADVNSVGNNGYSVLDQAVMYSPAVVDFLVEHGAQNRRK